MILSIDPGTTAGASVFAGRTPAVASFKNPTVGQVDRLIQWCQAAARERGEPLILVVEDQFVKATMVRIRGRWVPKVNFESIKVLVRATELWVVTAELRGVDRIERVMAATWQGPMHRGAAKELDTKGKSREVFARHWPEVYRFTDVPEPDQLKLVKASQLNEHIRDSGLMGFYAQHHMNLA